MGLGRGMFVASLNRDLVEDDSTQLYSFNLPDKINRLCRSKIAFRLALMYFIGMTI